MLVDTSYNPNELSFLDLDSGTICQHHAHPCDSSFSPDHFITSIGSESNVELSPMLVEKRVENINNTLWLSSFLIAILLSSLFLIGKHKKAYFFSVRNILSGKNRSVSYDEGTQSIFSYGLLWGLTIMSLTLFFIISVVSLDSAVMVLRNPLSILFYLSIAIAFMAIKYACFKMAGYIFNMKKYTSVYIVQYYTIVGMLGISLIPTSIGIIYSPVAFQQVMVFIGYFLIIIAFILIAFKSTQIFFSKYGSLLYILLYLCTLEILPVLVLIKAVYMVGKY